MSLPPTLPAWICDATSTPGQPSAKLRLKLVPGAKSSQIVGPLGDRLKLRVTAPPEDGKANKAVVNLLALALGLQTDRIDITTGRSSPEKEATIQGIAALDIVERITQDS